MCVGGWVGGWGARSRGGGTPHTHIRLAPQDADDPSPPVSAQQLALYAMLGPSIRMSDSFFKAASALGKPIHAWTVDTSEHLHRCVWWVAVRCSAVYCRAGRMWS